MKRGITISILVVTVVLMFILVTTATVVGVRSIQTASYEEFLSKIERVSDAVNKYIIANASLPTTFEIIAKEGLPNSLKLELNNKNDAENNLFVIDMTKLRTESVNIGKGTVEDMDVFIVAENTNNIYYLKGIEYRGKTYYGINAVWVSPDVVPYKWEENVVAMVNGVPIPKGFVASQAKGENTKAGGLVIYEGDVPVTDKNVEEAKRERNQYVWVPVENFSEFVRKDFKNTPSKVVDEDGNYYELGTQDTYWEVMVDENNLPLTTLEQQGATYMTTRTLDEVQAMYASVKEYRGFYIARYEAAYDAPHSKMGKIPCIEIRWTSGSAMNLETGGAVEKARNLYPKNDTNTTGVISTLPYGVQWDTILQWWLNTEVVSSVTESTSYANISSSYIALDTFNEGAKYSDIKTTYAKSYKDVTSNKPSGTVWYLTTGATEQTKINNIYDMAGNANEWTMEGKSGAYRISRGSSYAAGRLTLMPHNDANATGYRTALYIKK